MWATGDQLRTNPDLDPPVEGPMAVSGLQGVTKTLVRPLNDPPTEAFYIDFNGNTDDETAAEAGHVGKVAIWQDCSSPSAPDVEPPDFVMPPDFAIDYDTDTFNLTLEKWSASSFSLPLRDGVSTSRSRSSAKRCISRPRPRSRRG